MRILRRFLIRLLNFATPQSAHRRLQEEIAKHLAFQTEENLRAGMSPTEARRQAVLKTASRFAGVGEVKKRRVETCIPRYEQHESFRDVEEFHMNNILTRYAVCALAVTLMVPLAQAQGQPAGLQAAFGKDAGTLSDKFTGLARVMSGKYDWKPGQGDRSVGDVFNLIVTENRMLASALLGTPNTEAKAGMPNSE